MTRPCYIDRGGMLLPTHPDVWPSLGSHRSAFIDESTPIGYDQSRFSNSGETICNEARNGASEDCLKWLRLSVRLERPLCGRP